MATIRGWTGGAATHTARVARVWTEPATRPDADADERCWVTYRGGPHGHETGQVDVTPEAFDGFRVDGPVTIAVIHGQVHAQNCVYASNGNLAFDLVLLTIELAGIAIGLIWLFGARRPARVGPWLEPVAEPTRLGLAPAAARSTTPDRELWTAIALNAWVPPLLRCLWIAFPVFWLACVISFEVFDTKPAPLLIVVPVSITVGVVGLLAFPPRRWLALRLHDNVLTFEAGRRQRSMPLTDVRVIAGEHGFDAHSKASSPFIWKWLRVVGDDVDERIEMLPEDNDDCLHRLHALCPRAVALTPTGVVLQGEERPDERSTTRALTLLRRRAARDGLIATALAGVTLAAAVEWIGDPDPSNLGLVVTVAVFACLQAPRAYGSVRSLRGVRRAFGQRQETR